MTAAPPSGNGPGRDTQRTPNPPPCRVASCESPLQEFSGPRDRADAHATLDALGLGDVTGRCRGRTAAPVRLGSPPRAPARFGRHALQLASREAGTMPQRTANRTRELVVLAVRVVVAALPALITNSCANLWRRWRTCRRQSSQERTRA